MVHHVFIGSLLTLVTTCVHAVGSLVAIKGLKWGHPLEHSHTGRVLRISTLVVGMFLLSLLEALFWAYAYLQVGAIGDFEAALYFSLVTFTTLGYGDITFGPDWRMLAAFDAANGIIMFGWTTALVVAYLQRLMPKRSDS
jgi:hypothetical protein